MKKSRYLCSEINIINLENADGRAKVYIEPEIKVDYNQGIKPKDLKKALVMIENYREEIIKSWEEHH